MSNIQRLLIIGNSLFVVYTRSNSYCVGYTTTMEMSELEKHIEDIEERNKKVDLNKSWETSKTRRLSIAILTYFVIVAFLSINKTTNPFIGAIVPVLGFILSTLSLQVCRKVWEKYRN